MCTDFLLQAADKDNSVVIGRSMEFGEDLGSQILVGGRGTKKQSAAPDLPKGGLSWTAKYGYVGLNVAGLHLPNLICDGMNEKGLSIGALWLPGYTQYNSTVSSNSQALDVKDFANWVLGNFATVAEVQAGLTGVQIRRLFDKQPNSHSLLDSRCERRERGPRVPEGQHAGAVATQHCRRADQRSALRMATVEHRQLCRPLVGRCCTDHDWDTPYPPPGHGSGMRGVPGDSTPPSRFIRLLFQKQFATQPANNTNTISQALHLLNTVDIPLGTSAAQQKASKGNDDYTQWVVVKALTARTFSYRTADNPTLMQIDFADLDLGDAREVAYPMPQEATYIDITGQLVPITVESR